MDDNLYQPPRAVLSDSVTSLKEFYVVSIPKFWVLFTLTIGLYSVYWFYKNWSLQRKLTGIHVWPVPRGFFSIFFTHSLFRRIDNRLQEKQKDFSWNHSDLASIYVGSVIFSNVMPYFSSSPLMGILSILVLGFAGWALYHAQRAINLCCDNPAGEMNSRFSWINYLWMVLGIVFWVLVIAGTVLPIIYPELLAE